MIRFLPSVTLFKLNFSMEINLLLIFRSCKIEVKAEYEPSILKVKAISQRAFLLSFVVFSNTSGWICKAEMEASFVLADVSRAWESDFISILSGMAARILFLIFWLSNW